MNATCTTYHRGNLAIQTEKWVVPMDAAKRLMKEMKQEGEIRPGTYWQSNFATPTRRASRAKQDHVVVYTAGFSTGEFANKLACVGCEHTHNFAD